MCVAMLGGVRVDRHAAHRILDALLRMLVRIVPGMRRMGVSLLSRHDHPSLSVSTLGVHVDMYTPAGYQSSMSKPAKAASITRLSRIEGQVRGLARMVEEDRYCIDIVTQIAAVRAALRRVEEEVLREHISHCVEDAIVSGNAAERRRKVTELMDVLSRTAR